MTDDEALRRATELWQEGCRLQMAGELDHAIAVYKRSIEVHPTAEAHTYLGWTYSFQGKLDEAIPWLEKAKRAPRYEPRQFPYMNLGRIHLRQGRWWNALREFEGAVRAAPTDVEARKALHTLRGRLN